TKHGGTGGLVSEETVKEQLVYEIKDPQNYLMPDCKADFTSVQLEADGPDRVRVYGIEGKPPTSTYKVSASYSDGYKLSSTLVYSWPRALAKAKRAGKVFKKRAQALDIEIGEYRAEYIGVNACNEQHITAEQLTNDYSEFLLRVSVSGKDESALNRVGKEVVLLMLTGPSEVTGYAGGRPKDSEVVAYWPALLDKEAIDTRVRNV